MPDNNEDSTSDPSECIVGTSRRGFLTRTVALGSAAIGGGPISATADVAVPANPRLYTYVGGKGGGWSVESTKTIVGEPLPVVERISIVHGAVDGMPDGGKWILRGVTSNERYANREEKKHISIQKALGRPEADHGAFIPIKKNAAWWALTQDERRAIFEERSKHITIGFKYMPTIARRLQHCRDLSENEPFDFLTVFDYTKADMSAFDDMLAELRASEEWKYVDREVDLRLVRIGA